MTKLSAPPEKGVLGLESGRADDWKGLAGGPPESLLKILQQGVATHPLESIKSFWGFIFHSGLSWPLPSNQRAGSGEANTQWCPLCQTETLSSPSHFPYSLDRISFRKGLLAK